MPAVRLRKICGRGVEFLRFPVPGRSRTIVRFPPVTGKIHPLYFAFDGSHRRGSYAKENGPENGPFFIARPLSSRHSERSRRITSSADTIYRFLLLSRWLRLQYDSTATACHRKNLPPPLLCPVRGLDSTKHACKFADRQI